MEQEPDRRRETGETGRITRDPRMNVDGSGALPIPGAIVPLEGEHLAVLRPADMSAAAGQTDQRGGAAAPLPVSPGY
jgi:hypothetical protein